MMRTQKRALPIQAGMLAAVAAVTAVTALALVGGCVSKIDSSAAEPIRSFVEPEHGSGYLLYRPSSYDRRYSWPLVVVCHSAFTDSPRRQIRDWAQVAEREGMLVAAPTLTAVRKSFARKPKVQRELLREDEARILSVIRHVCAGHRVSEDRVFVYGYSGGAHSAVFTGLRHPGMFRAIGLVSPAFDEAYLSAGDIAVAPHQPVFLNYSVADSITGKNGRRCAKWLRGQGAAVHVDAHGKADRTEVPRVAAFFGDVVRRRAWMNIRTRPTADGNPNARQFELRATPKPKTVRWSFGDGDESSVTRPLHIYARPGSYRVEVHATFDDRESDSRSVVLAVPQGTTAPAAETGQTDATEP